MQASFAATERGHSQSGFLSVRTSDTVSDAGSLTWRVAAMNLKPNVLTDGGADTFGSAGVVQGHGRVLLLHRRW